jgi:L-seryl-tRNA(Ser) seleniumtransferase
MKSKLAKFPSIDLILNQEKAIRLSEEYSRELIKQKCQNKIEKMRSDILAGKSIKINTREALLEDILENVKNEIKTEMGPSLKPVINATGIILHTGLGRAPLAKVAQENIAKIASGYSNLEINLENGKRGERTEHVEKLICDLTGAEAALIVNNNAAAVFIALNTLAFGKEAIISRGQLVEIGGSFRIPDVMDKSGCLKCEVGTTNKTKISDYKNAINENTGAVVVAHTSNYRIVGFTEEVELGQIAQLCSQNRVPLIHDLGAGVIFDLRELGLPYEPLVQDSIRAGADVVTFSGDKILGGPQCGIIVGKKEWLKKVHKNPIMRAVRCDKLIYAALEATLKLYFKRKNLLTEHETLRMLSEPIEKVNARAKKALELTSSINKNVSIKIVDSSAQTGSGALPTEKIASKAIAIKHKNKNSEKIAKAFRSNNPPIMGYVKNEEFYMDMRTVLDSEVELLAKAIILIVA